jgi:hypothetical protein
MEKGPAKSGDLKQGRIHKSKSNHVSNQPMGTD